VENLSNIQTGFVNSLIAAQGMSNSADEFCMQITHRVLHRHSVLGVLIVKIGADSKCHQVGKYGNWNNLPPSGLLEIWDNSPLGLAIRNNQTVFVGPESNGDTMGQSPSIPNARGHAILPFNQSPTALGAIVIAFDGPSAKDFSELPEIGLVTSAAEFFAYSSRYPARLTGQRFQMSPQPAQIAQGTELTNRELGILKLMAEEKTNYQIGKAFNLSESTIKQESVKIFRKLGVENRRDAAVKASQMRLI
jgi:DNA-binding CsgD family transcriptional regulator